MTTYNFGDIILVPFPFTNQAVSKKRPAVVISSELYNIERHDIILMAVTSHIRQENKVGEAAIKDWQAAGMLKPSMIKPIITTTEKSLILKKTRAVNKKGPPGASRNLASNNRKGERLENRGRSSAAGFSRYAASATASFSPVN